MSETPPVESTETVITEEEESEDADFVPPDSTVERKSVSDSEKSNNSDSSSDESMESTEDEETSEKTDVVPVRNHPLEDLTYEDLSSNVNELQAEYSHLVTENNMFERYLLLNDPQALEGIEQMIENAFKLQVSEPFRRATLAETYSVKSSSASKLGSSFVGTGSVTDKGPRINLTQKTDMVMKEMEELQKSLNKLQKDAHKKKCVLKAELEEVGIEIAETQAALDQFEQIVVAEGFDPLTQRIPAEKFVRYVQEWLKTSLSTIQKYRLRQNTLTCQLRKLKETLKQKKELGESLHAVDFEKLQIENNHFVQEIDLRTIQLVDLKRLNGGANLILTNQKKFLMKQISEMKKIQKDIDDTRSKIEGLEKEIEIAEEQLQKVNIYYDNIKQMTEEYRVPDVMEYVRIKGKVYELQKNIKIWSRRVHLQDVALNSSIREMKNITGSKKVLDSWFHFSQPQAEDLDLELNIDSESSDEEPDSF